jgi:hypothetical protein
MRRRTLLLVILLSVFPWLLSVSAAKATVEVRSALLRSCDHMARQWSSPVEAPLILAQNPTACSCPDVECEKGTMEGCDADCDPPEQAYCGCASDCDADGNTVGSNICACR